MVRAVLLTCEGRFDLPQPCRDVVHLRRYVLLLGSFGERRPRGQARLIGCRKRSWSR